MSDLYDRLLAAGAPRVEEPRFFRIRIDECSPARLTVSLRERGPGLASRLLARAYTEHHPADPTTATVDAMWEALDAADTDDGLAEHTGDVSRPAST